MADAVPDPLRYDWTSQRVALRDYRLWDEMSVEVNNLIAIAQRAQAMFRDVRTDGEYPDGVIHAAADMQRLHAAIHEHALREQSYVRAARRLMTDTQSPPAFTDAHILAMLALLVAAESATAFSDLAAGVEEEIEAAGLAAGEVENINALRARLAVWERQCWVEAIRRMAEADKFLMIAQFAQATPDALVVQQIEAALARAERDISRYRQGRPKGAVGKLARALKQVLKEAPGTGFEAVLNHLRDIAEEEVEGIEFQEVTDTHVHYLDVESDKQGSISIASLRVRLQQLKTNSAIHYTLLSRLIAIDAEPRSAMARGLERWRNIHSVITGGPTPKPC